MPNRYNTTRRNYAAVSGSKKSRKAAVSHPVAVATPRGVRVRVYRRIPAGSRIPTMRDVKRILHQYAENKKRALFASADHNSLVSSVGDLLPLLPSVPQGTTQTTRNGNKITPRGIRVMVTIAMNTDTIHAGSDGVILPRIMVLSQRDTKDMGTLIANGGDQSHLLDDGISEFGFDGTIRAYHAPVNHECFTVHKDIRTKLSIGSVEQNSLLSRTFTFWVKCPSVLDYNDLQNYPRNFAPFMYVGFATPSGTVYSSITPLKVSYTSTLYYEDD